MILAISIIISKFCGKLKLIIMFITERTKRSRIWVLYLNLQVNKHLLLICRWKFSKSTSLWHLLQYVKRLIFFNILSLTCSSLESNINSYLAIRHSSHIHCPLRSNMGPAGWKNGSPSNRKKWWSKRLKSKSFFLKLNIYSVRNKLYMCR